MPQKLMDVLMLGRCSHEFSWPRRAADGQFYQVCLLCAVEYSYDWTTMRRTERVDRTQSATEAEGTIANLSQSGVLLQGPQRFPDNTLVEMVFEMPEEISGQKNSTVLCQGRITRTKDVQDKDKKETQEKTETSKLAASILDYKFLHQT